MEGGQDVALGVEGLQGLRQLRQGGHILDGRTATCGDTQLGQVRGRQPEAPEPHRLFGPPTMTLNIFD